MLYPLSYEGETGIISSVFRISSLLRKNRKTSVYYRLYYRIMKG